MMLTGMQGVTPNVARAMKAIEGSGRRVTSHSVDDAPRRKENSSAVFLFGSGDASPVVLEKSDRRRAVIRPLAKRSGRAPVLIEAAMAAVRANLTLSAEAVAKIAGCSVGTVRDARRRLRMSGVVVPRYVPPAPMRDALIAAVRANGSRTLAEYAALTGMTVECVNTYLTRLRADGVIRKTLVVVDRA